MILKVQGADFSANNIGKITFPVILSQFTLNAIVASGNNSMTSEQQQALEMFFRNTGAINNIGIWSKLDKVYIPFVTQNMANAYVNFKNNNVDATLNTEYFEYRNKGVCKNETAASPNSPDLLHNNAGSYKWNWSDKSVVVMNTEGYPYTPGTPYTNAFSIMCDSYANDSKWQALKRNIGGAVNSNYESFTLDQSNSNIVQSVDIITGIAQQKDAGVFAVSVKNNDVKILFANGSLKEYTASEYSPSTVEGTLYLYGVSRTGGSNKNILPIGSMLLGNALTEEEMKLAQSELMKLWDAFK